MAKVTTAKCDRCGRFCRDEEVFARVGIFTAPQGRGEDAPVDSKELDLCDDCERGLLVYIDGGELGRKWKAKAAKVVT